MSTWGARPQGVLRCGTCLRTPSPGRLASSASAPTGGREPLGAVPHSGARARPERHRSCSFLAGSHDVARVDLKSPETLVEEVGLESALDL